MSLEKIVKLACKPKAAPPKAKYIDPIIAATYSDDGAVSDVCRALAPRFREPNAIVVFKALIVLHTMIRNGNTDNVLSYLASSDILRLHNVSQGHWDGYRAPENLAHYAQYMESRVKAYRDLKHDAIRVQTESNRDHRVSVLEDDRPSHSGVQRSKTVIGRKLRVMTVEKGLLRETKIVQGVIDTLVDTQFYLDDLEDELNITALRMLVKDLLVLFQAGNEGVINLLEHYFEMSHVDAENALALYRKFCRQTERVVDYLSVAKKLQNLINVSIPNLKHAPVSLVGALEEYLRDPNFEQNRLEYRANKAAADGKGPVQKRQSPVPPVPAAPAVASTSTSIPTPVSSSPALKPQDQSVQDFFSSIEQEQSSIFNPNTNSPTATYFQQQANFNPFVQRQSMMMTGAGFMGSPQTGPFVAPQPTGFLQPQPTSFPSSNQLAVPGGMAPQMTGFPSQQMLPQQATGFLQPRPTSAFLQPQATGSNPFRQSMLMPQSADFQAFGTASQPSHNPFPRSGSAMAFNSTRSASPPPFRSTSPFGRSNVGQNAFENGSSPGFRNNNNHSIARPASTPIKSNAPVQGPVLSHQTGSRNPFGQPLPPPVPPLPKGPTLQELASGSAMNPPSSSNLFPSSSTFPPASGSLQPHHTGGGGLLSNIASSFATGPPSSPLNIGVGNLTSSSSPPPLPSITTGSAFSSLSSQPTSSSAWSPSTYGSSAFTSSVSSTAATSPPIQSPIQPQPTGFGGSAVKPFKPSSSFGASLLEKLPPIPSEPSTPQANGGSHPSLATTGALNAQPTGYNFPSSFGNNNALGNGLGGGLRPQPTGAANPFRASMFAGAGSGSPTGRSPGPDFSSMMGSQFNVGSSPGPPQVSSNPTGLGAFSSQFGSGFGSFGSLGVPNSNQGQQPQTTQASNGFNTQSLI